MDHPPVPTFEREPTRRQKGKTPGERPRRAECHGNPNGGDRGWSLPNCASKGNGDGVRLPEPKSG